MPASSSIVLRPLWSSLPWIRLAALKLVDSLLQVVLDLLVGGGTHGRRRQVTVAEQLGVDVAGGAERLLEVVVQVVVVQRAIHVRPRGLGGVVEPFLRLGHPARPFGF